MLIIRRIKIENFVCFRNLEIVPSIDPSRPLTVIRAENGSGKTTFLRALRWGMYGEQGLPGEKSNFSVHPADWQPTSEGIKTTVNIEFETDGSSRNNPGRKGTANTVFELIRSVITVGQPSEKPESPDFRRLDEQVQLMAQNSDGSWYKHSATGEAVVNQLLPWDLRDFIVMDADEAADFVGGSENKDIKRAVVVKKTTDAISALLGIDIFRKSSDRVQRIGRDFERQATKATQDATLESQQTELDAYRKQAETLSRTIAEESSNLEDVEDRLARARFDFESMLKGDAKQDELKLRLQEVRKRGSLLENMRSKETTALASELSSIELLGALGNREVEEVFRKLKPLYDANQIPMKHLSFVQSLLERGQCICGQDLRSNGSHKRCVEQTLRNSKGLVAKANHLAQVLDATRTLLTHNGIPNWDERCDNSNASLGNLETQEEEVELEQRSIERELDSLADNQVQHQRNKIATLEEQAKALHRSLSTDRPGLELKRTQIDELGKRLLQSRKRIHASQEKEACHQVASAVMKILDRAFSTIQSAQVEELSKEMNQLFHEMAVGVKDEEFDPADRQKTTPRMIEKVGVRPLANDQERFEIYALNSRKRSMPPTEINGASRRILALSFVLALCRVSNTKSPLIADSLLNFMSGSVRTNTLRVITQSLRQPILLLTTSDLEAPIEAKLVREFGGSTYTLTSQWQHVDEGGDVLRRHDSRPVSLACECGPREFCVICERDTWDSKPEWQKRPQRRMAI